MTAAGCAAHNGDLPPPAVLRTRTKGCGGATRGGLRPREAILSEQERGNAGAHKQTQPGEKAMRSRLGGVIEAGDFALRTTTFQVISVYHS
jgi:hypothetical protein